jgi:hypothetical protein
MLRGKQYLKVNTCIWLLSWRTICTQKRSHQKCSVEKPPSTLPTSLKIVILSHDITALLYGCLKYIMSLPLCCSFGNYAYLTVTNTVASKLHLEFLPPHMVINWCLSLASNALQCSLLLHGGFSETIQDCNPFGGRLDVAWVLFVLQHKISELCMARKWNKRLHLEKIFTLSGLLQQD